jgi:hemolysin activation/secretion protein
MGFKSKIKHRTGAATGLQLGAGAAIALLCGGQALAQAIERNLPPQVQHGASVILTPAVTPMDNDDHALGPRLTAIVVLGPHETVRSAPPITPVDLAQAQRLDTPAMRGRLQRFIGKPLSRKLIAEIEAKIVQAYRGAGFPLVSVSTPEQEISSGVVQVRVIEFRLGTKTASGVKAPDYVLSRVRASPGQPIDTEKLAQDLDWLNRYPFRSVQAAFSPGDKLGATNLILQATQTKPWSVYVGYADSGSPLTGFDRYLAGASVAIPGLHDAYASYQFTGSNDVLFSQDRPFNSAADPLYLSHSGRIVIPTLPRQDIEASLSYVQSNEFGQFTAHQFTEEASVGYRSALSNILAALPGEAVVGVEAKRETGSTIFADEPVQHGDVDVFQVYVGYSGQESDGLGRTSGDVTLHISPGGVNSRNTDADFAVASQGRSRSAEYAYISADLTRSFQLPFGLGYSVNLIGQYAPNPVPLTEQIGLGGPSLVRGYTLDDGVFDSGLLARNELRAPSEPLLSKAVKGVQDGVQPFAFIDAGWAKNEYTHADASPVGAGFGADYQLGRHLAADLTTAWALKHEGLTRSGQFRLESRVTLSF